MSTSLRLESAELATLSTLLGLRLTPLSDPLMTRSEALDSLVRRGMVDAKVERVALSIATLLAILARPTHQVSISRFGNSRADHVIALQAYSHVVHSRGDRHELLTPCRDGLSHLFPDTEASPSESFSIPGRTWHDMVMQAKFATLQQLARMAEIDGLDASHSTVAATLAKAHHERFDARVLSYRGRNRWRGTEVSWIFAEDRTWLVDDGARFGQLADLANRRAMFSRGRADEAIREALSSLDSRF